MSNSYKDQSRLNWQPNTDRQVTNEEIQMGAIQRIADATEKMATNFTDILHSRDWFKNQYERKCREADKLQRQVNAYRGMLKKKAKLKKQ